MNGYRVQTLNTTISLYWHWLFFSKENNIKWQQFFIKASFSTEQVISKETLSQKKN